MIFLCPGNFITLSCSFSVFFGWFELLRVPKGERNFDLTYLRAPWAVGIIIAYLSFSAIWYFLFKFSWKNIHGEKSYRGWNFFSFELRCGHEVLLTISQPNHGNNSILDRERAQTNVSELVPLELLAERSRGCQPGQNNIMIPFHDRYYLW